MIAKKYLSYLVIFLFMYGYLSQQVRSDDISDVKDRLIKEAIPAWQNLEKNHGNLTFTVFVTRDDIKKTSGRNFAYSKSALSIVGNNMLECVYLDKEDGTVMENFRCKNKKYYFEIDKAKKENPWQINELSLKGINNYDQITFQSYEIISTGWSILNIPMENIINDSTFEIKSVATNKNTDNDELITITFTLLNNKLPLKLFNDMQIGTVTFNKTRNWIIINYELSSYNKTNNYNYKGICKCEYDFSKDTPYMKTYTYTLEQDIIKQKKVIKVTWVAEVQKIEPCTMRNKDFMLSAFGLHEPKELNPPLHHKVIRYVFILSGLILILLGLCMKYLARSKNGMKL